MATASQSMSTAVPSPAELREALVRIAGAGRVLTRPIDLLAFAADASFYRLIPRAVVLAKGTEEIQSLFEYSHASRIPLTFRAAGTSLSGQAITDGILVEVARHWRGARAEDGGKKVRVQPGIIGGQVNQMLRPYGVKMGPDPASINACMMGGILANNSSGMCCGVPFSSKGFDQAHDLAANTAIERFWRWSDEGRLPVVVDTSPCTYGLLTCRASLTPESQKKFDGLKILDAVAFVHDQLLPKLTVRRKQEFVALHPVCSVVKMNLTPKLEAVARACSNSVLVPQAAGCCGFAGDRGFLFPELTESATRLEAAEIAAAKFDGDGTGGDYFSSSRTCEIGMTRATGRLCRSFIFLVEQATRP